VWRGKIARPRFEELLAEVAADRSKHRSLVAAEGALGGEQQAYSLLAERSEALKVVRQDGFVLAQVLAERLGVIEQGIPLRFVRFSSLPPVRELLLVRRAGGVQDIEEREAVIAVEVHEARLVQEPAGVQATPAAPAMNARRLCGGGP